VNESANLIKAPGTYLTLAHEQAGYMHARKLFQRYKKNLQTVSGTYMQI